MPALFAAEGSAGSTTETAAKMRVTIMLMEAATTDFLQMLSQFF